MGPRSSSQDDKLVEVVASRPNARAYRVQVGPDGDVDELPLATRYLGA